MRSISFTGYNAAKFEKQASMGEERIRKRQKEATEHKQRTLQMYDQMAKSAPAGGQKVLDVSILKDGTGGSVSPTVPASGPKRDLVEEAIQERIKAADMEKQRILAAYDAAAKSGPAGMYKVADLKNFSKANAANFTPSKPTGSCTFGASGGIPIVNKGLFSSFSSPFLLPVTSYV